MKKELVIAAKFDTSDFDKSVELMQKKLKDLYAPADMIRAQTMQQNITTNGRLGQNGNNQLDGGSVEAFKKATQSARRELDTLINREVASQNKLGKELATKLDKLKELKVEQEKGNKTLEDELKIKKQISEVEKSTWGMREQFKNRNENINTLIDAKEKNSPRGIEKLMDAYRSGGVGGEAQTAGKMFAGLGPTGMIGMAGAGIAGVGTLMSAAANGYRQYSRIPLEIAASQGSAAANTSGKDLSNIYSGRSSFEGMWQEERGRAAKRAVEAMNAHKEGDKYGLYGSMLKAGGIGMGAGAGIGGLIGNIPGAAIGGAIGGGAGGIMGLLNASPNERDLGLSQLPFVGERFAKNRTARIASEAASNYATSNEDEKNMNPLKKMALDDFESNMSRNLGAKRAMGLTDDQFTRDNGYLKGITDKGFTHNMGIGMSNEILGAGGSAGMAKDSGFGLQMQRMGVTNAGSVLGSLSGAIRDPESTKRASISIMSEAMKIGLNQSDFSEENRRFTQAAANIIARTGATGEKDQDRLSAMLGQFVGNRTNQGIASASTAYEASQNRDSQLEGRRGVLRMVGAQSDPILSKLSSPDQIHILGMRPEDMSENNPEIVSMALKAGTTPKELIESATKNNKGARYTGVGQAEEVKAARNKIAEFKKNSGMSNKQFMEGLRENTLPQEGQAAYGALTMAQSRDKAGNLNPADRDARAAEEMPEDAPSQEKTWGKSLKNSVEAMLNSKTRVEDKFNAGAATDNDVARVNFNKMSGEIDHAAETASKATTAFREMAIELSSILAKSNKNKDNTSIEDFLNKMAAGGASTQQQSGKGKQ